MFRITYVYHSCFTIELDNTVLIFDYTQGVLPQFDTEKTIYVFASHRHPDHFKPKVFELVRFIETERKYNDVTLAALITLYGIDHNIR